MKKQIEKLIDEYKSLLPLEDNAKKKLEEKFRLEFNFNSNHLEGNTLTYGEAKLLLLFDQTKGSHELREYEEMKAHDVALKVIKEEAREISKPLTEKFIKDLNEIILVRPYWKDAQTADGQSTRRQIQVGTYKEYPNSVIQANGEIFEYASPSETPIRMAELVDWYNKEVDKKEFSPIELAGLLHYEYIRIHPFDDGNGRVARLLVNYVLYKNNLPPVIIKTDDKKNYLRALQQADAGNLQAFIDYMTQQLAWSLDLCIKADKGESIEEPNDWEKELALLKRKIGHSVNEKPVIHKSKKIVEVIYNKVIYPLISKYDNVLNKFEDIFVNRKSSIYLNQFKPVTGHTMSDLLDSLPMQFDQNVILDTESLSIKSNFSKLKKDVSNVTVHAPSILFTFYKDSYSIRIGSDKAIPKLYSDLFTEEEMDEIMNNIAKTILAKVAKHIQ